MSGDRLIALLTEIRDQQRQQIANFEAALRTQAEMTRIQQRGRSAFLFLVYAPWVAMVALLLVFGWRVMLR